MRRPRPPKRSTVIVWIVVLLLALAGTVAYVLIKLEVFAPSLSEQVSSIQKTDGSWWLGMSFEGLPPGANADAPRDVLYTVTDIYPEHVVLDGNHPLAGIAIRLHLKVDGVREATEDEIGRGSAGTGFFKVQRGAPDGTPLH